MCSGHSRVCSIAQCPTRYSPWPCINQARLLQARIDKTIQFTTCTSAQSTSRSRRLNAHEKTLQSPPSTVPRYLHQSLQSMRRQTKDVPQLPGTFQPTRMQYITFTQSKLPKTAPSSHQRHGTCIATCMPPPHGKSRQPSAGSSCTCGSSQNISSPHVVKCV